MTFEEECIEACAGMKHPSGEIGRLQMIAAASRPILYALQDIIKNNKLEPQGMVKRNLKILENALNQDLSITDVQKLVRPCCPHCFTEIPKIGLAKIAEVGNGMVLSSFYCQACGAILAVHLLNKSFFAKKGPTLFAPGGGIIN